MVGSEGQWQCSRHCLELRSMQTLGGEGGVAGPTPGLPQTRPLACLPVASNDMGATTGRAAQIGSFMISVYEICKGNLEWGLLGLEKD